MCMYVCVREQIVIIVLRILHAYARMYTQLQLRVFVYLGNKILCIPCKITRVYTIIIYNIIHRIERDMRT